MPKIVRLPEEFDVGVIVGRFQLPELHPAHADLIQHVADQHDRVIIVLGLSPLWATKRNPLDFEARKQMILEKFPNAVTAYIRDVGNDEVWSKRLDSIVRDLVAPRQKAVLYGGRESFIPHYNGKLPVRELEQSVWISGTEIREQVAKRRARPTADFRAGVVWAAYNRFPTAFPTVDVAVYSPDGNKLLLGKKPGEPLYRFIGGFAAPDSESYEDDARREVREEAGVEISEPEYLGSFKIDDWRYRGEEDKIKTLLFRATHIGGTPQAADDIAEARWFGIDTLVEDVIMPAHRPLFRALSTSRYR